MHPKLPLCTQTLHTDSTPQRYSSREILQHTPRTQAPWEEFGYKATTAHAKNKLTQRGSFDGVYMNFASFPGLPPFYLPFGFTIIHGSGRRAFKFFADLPILCIIVNTNGR